MKKKNQIKRIAALAIAVIMTASFAVLTAGCGNDRDIVGEWEGGFDPTGVLKDSLKSTEEGEMIAAWFEDSGDEVRIKVILKDDGTYSIDIDNAFLKESIRSWLIDGYTKCKANGVKLVGETPEDSADIVLLTALIFDSMAAGMENSGNYSASGGKLCLSSDMSHDPDGRKYEEYEISADGGTLTLTGGKGTDYNGFFAGFYPLSMKRIK